MDMNITKIRNIVWVTAASVLLLGAKGAPSAADFPFRLYQRLSNGRPGHNLIYSPHSVSQAFFMADLGARGQTQSQIERNIDLKSSIAPPSTGENAPALWIANRIWLARDIKVDQSYLESSQKQGGATPGYVDFADRPAEAANTINSWVQTQTHGKIRSLIPAGALNARTRLILTNAVYFKGPWENPFKKELTSNAHFTLSSGATLSVPFMHEHERMDFIQDSLAQVIKLPYLGREFAMVIVLPKKGVSPSKVSAALSAKRLESWEGKMNFADVELALPRFKFDSDFVLNSELQSLGVRLPFDPGHADFSGIDGKKDLYVAKVFHKAFISVDEAGTEAAAATAIEMRMKAVIHVEKPIVMNVDHPFVFMIQDLRSKAILFIGRVANPKE